ncbi:MAG: hypothetical protein K2Q07_08135 [Burkholderiaceae bacterium]|nr:hypothetical protein [Burkholderiaceae bacterium]
MLHSFDRHELSHLIDHPRHGLIVGRHYRERQRIDERTARGSFCVARQVPYELEALADGMKLDDLTGFFVDAAYDCRRNLSPRGYYTGHIPTERRRT